MIQRSSNYYNDPIGFGDYGDEMEAAVEPDCAAKEKYLATLTEEQLLLASPVVKGYSMGSKAWGKYSCFSFDKSLTFKSKVLRRFSRRCCLERQCF